MHKLLARQLQRFFGSEASIPEAIEPFLSAVDEAYRQADDDRELLEHSMDTVSEELVERYEQLQQALTESQQAEADLRAALSLVEATLEATADGILVVDEGGRIVRTNERFAELWGIPDEVLASRENERALEWVLDQLEDPDAFLTRVRELYADPEIESFDTIEFKDGRVIERYSKLQKIEGETVGRVWSFRDITERRELEEQLRHSQKMQAVGNLAGGIAHDFNNLLTVIQCHAAELERGETLPDDPSGEAVREIAEAARRAAELTGQLLAYSRKQILRPVPLDLNRVVREVEPMLRRLIGEDIEIRTRLEESIGAVEADRGQLGQVIVNLALNARDAMPGGGRLEITTEEVLHEGTGPHARAGMPPGRYVAMTVSDTGHGVPLEDRPRIFEPFFTTKEAGKGTGLGLATVYGIIKQSEGHIWLDDDSPSVEGSRDGADGGPGRETNGATFQIYLPVTEGSPESVARETVQRPPERGTETILVAEDEAAVRRVIQRLLERGGYEVIAAPSGRDAASLASDHEGPIDLVLTDLVMPDLSGRELATLIRTSRPDTPILFMSGYTDDEITRRGVIREGAPFIQKPFLGPELMRAVREALDRGAGPTSQGVGG